MLVSCLALSFDPALAQSDPPTSTVRGAAPGPVQHVLPSGGIPVSIDPPPNPPTRHYIEHPVWLTEASASDIAGFYPSAAEGRAGLVVLDCIVSSDGAIQCAIVRRSSEDGTFDAPALRVAHRYRMAPVDADGAPTAAQWVQLPVSFAAR
ncbi:MAG: TonB family protein [Pseudomonadota bacterium]